MSDEHIDILNSRSPFDITKPRMLNVGGYCVRDFQVHNLVIEKSASLKPYDEDDDIVNCADIDEDFEISITKSGKFLLQFHVAPAFFRYIIGPHGGTRREIEQQTLTHIKIPREGENKDVVITGQNERSVITTKNRIDLIVLQARDKHPLTHFISIPMISNMIKHNFDIFRSALINGPLIRGLDASLFQNPNKIHLTIAPLVLADEVEQNEALKIFKQCQEDIIKPIFNSIEPIRVILQGVEIMNDDPTNVDILYGKVTVDPPKYNDYFQKMANEIVKCFAQKGLIREQFENVKLHATLINSLFKKNNVKQPDSGSTSKINQKREPFDASYILKKYKSFYFGETELNCIHLSIRMTTSKNGYYEDLVTLSIK